MSTIDTFIATRERIEARAQAVDLVRMLLTLVAAPFYVAGWLIGKVAVAVTVVLKWVFAAAAEGFDAARPDRRPT